MSAVQIVIFDLLRRMRRPFLDGGEDHNENSSSMFGVRNHERNEDIEER